MHRSSLPRFPPILAALLALALAMPILATGVASKAEAHAALIEAEPADGAVTAVAPTRFVFRFSEPVSPLVLRLVSPGGATTVLRGAALEGNALVVPAPPGLARGTHVLSWRVVSEDGHPVGGSVLFSIGAPSDRPGRAASLDWPVLAFVWSTKVLLYLGLFVGVGGIAYGAVVQRLEGATLRAVRSFLAAGLLAAPLALAAQGLDALDAPLRDAFRPAVWAAGFATAFGRTVAAATAALVAALVATRLPRGLAANGLAALALAGVGFALAASGHASSAPPQWLTRPAVFVHAAAVAFWVGSLLPLAIAFEAGSATRGAALRRFSAAIPWAVAPLVVSGILLAVIQVRVPAALWTTAYGWVLAAKLAMLAPLFALAAWNRWSLTAKAVEGRERAAERMGASIAVETALVLLILATVALWRFTPPPRVLADAVSRPAVVHLASGKLRADVTVAPGHAGPVAVRAVLTAIDGGPVNPKAVTFVFANPGAGVESIRKQAARPGGAAWAADADLPVPGRWRVRIDVLVDDFTLERIEGEVDLPP